PRLHHLSFLFSTPPPPPRSTLFPYTTLFRSKDSEVCPAGSSVASNCSGKPMISIQYSTSRNSAIFRFPIDSSINSASRTSISWRSEEHTSELQSRFDLVCRLLLEKKKSTQLH